MENSFRVIVFGCVSVCRTNALESGVGRRNAPIALTDWICLKRMCTLCAQLCNDTLERKFLISQPQTLNA